MYPIPLDTFSCIGADGSESKQASKPTMATPAVTTDTSTATPAAPECATAKNPAPEEPLDEVDMFSQALMQLNETNKQVSYFQGVLSQFLCKTPSFIYIDIRRNYSKTAQL